MCQGALRSYITRDAAQESDVENFQDSPKFYAGRTGHHTVCANGAHQYQHHSVQPKLRTSETACQPSFAVLHLNDYINTIVERSMILPCQPV